MPIPTHGSSCKECRARKVKCDRTPLRCMVCIRLDLDCSYGRSQSPVSERADSSELTQAGTKRKRTRRACLACRTVKAKCSGNRPCERCLAKQLPCDGSADNAMRGMDLNQLSIPRPADLPQDSPNSGSVNPGTASSTSFEELERATTRSYLDSYFEAANRSTVPILHKSTVLADWSRGKLDPALLKVILTTAQYARDGYAGGTAAVRLALDEIQRHTIANWSSYSLNLLQVLVLLTRLRFQAGDYVEVWNLLPLAARMAFTLRLNHEQEHPNAVHQECRRRLLWAIFHLDRQFSGGLEDLAVCPPEKIHVRLPCDEHTFRRGAASRAAFLSDPEVQDDTGVDVYAFLLRVLVIRDRVLRYTKRLKRTGVVPSTTYSEMQAIQAELDHFEETLPADLKFSSERTMLMAHSPESVKYVGLHTQWYQSHCDLYRICVPGLRESLSMDVLARTPTDFIDRCQQTCLNNALRLCDLWSSMYRLEPGDETNNPFLPISIYSAAQICRHLRHLLPTQGDNTLRSVKQKLMDALRLSRPLEIMPGPRKCMRDAERIIDSLEEGTREGSSRASSVGAEVSQDYLPSKHTLLPRFSKLDDERTPPSVDLRTSSAAPSGQEEPAARIMMDMAGGAAKQVGSGGEFERGGMVSWDPFDMQMNDYYDSELRDLLASFEDVPRLA